MRSLESLGAKFEETETKKGNYETTRKLIDRIAQRSAKLAGKIIKPAATSATEQQQPKPSARRIVLNEDV
jgi:hypothetical protein